MKKTKIETLKKYVKNMVCQFLKNKNKNGVITSLYLQGKYLLYTPTYHGRPKACLRSPLQKKDLPLRKKTASSIVKDPNFIKKKNFSNGCTLLFL